MCVLVSQDWKFLPGAVEGDTGCTPVYFSGKTISDVNPTELSDISSDTTYDMFDYYAVSNGDAFNTKHRPGHPPAVDNAFI